MKMIILPNIDGMYMTPLTQTSWPTTLNFNVGTRLSRSTISIRRAFVQMSPPPCTVRERATRVRESEAGVPTPRGGTGI